MAPLCTKNRPNPLISVVLITWNRKEDLKKCLDSLENQKNSDFDIVLVDNGSNDGTPEVIENKYPDIRLIKLPYNEGVPGARNIGAANAKGKLLFFLDDDATIEKDTLEKIIERFVEDQTLSVIACNLIDYSSHQLIKRRYDSEYHTADFPGGAVVIKKELFQQLGYYPKDFFYHAEETDLSLRIYDAGFYIKYCPEILVYHKPSHVERPNWRYIYYSTRNNIWVSWKYLPFWSAFKNTIYQLIINLKKSFEYRLTRYYIKGVWHGILGIPKILNKRKPINKHAQREIKRLLKGLNNGGR
jgi:GT2 family glycosyltransferase